MALEVRGTTSALSDAAVGSKRSGSSSLMPSACVEPNVASSSIAGQEGLMPVGTAYRRERQTARARSAVIAAVRAAIAAAVLNRGAGRPPSAARSTSRHSCWAPLPRQPLRAEGRSMAQAVTMSSLFFAVQPNDAPDGERESSSLVASRGARSGASRRRRSAGRSRSRSRSSTSNAAGPRRRGSFLVLDTGAEPALAGTDPGHDPPIHLLVLPGHPTPSRRGSRPTSSRSRGRPALPSDRAC